jgi:protein involved in polysaccharide export with SLBB domain
MAPTRLRPALGFLLVLCALLPTAFGAAPPPDSGDGKNISDNGRALRVGDPLAVSILGLEGTGKNTIVDVNVNEEGQITLPMLSKPVPAKGLTTEKLRDAIVKEYRQARLIQNANVTVKFRPGKENEARALGVGDALVVTILDLEGPGKNTIVKADVDPKGEITLPMLSKPVPAKGLTREKLCAEIIKAYERDQLIANATVIVKFRNSVNKEPQAPKDSPAPKE